MALNVGFRLGPYEIISAIGAERLRPLRAAKSASNREWGWGPTSREEYWSLALCP